MERLTSPELRRTDVRRSDTNVALWRHRIASDVGQHGLTTPWVLTTRVGLERPHEAQTGPS